jgi:hypothetical protein
MNNDILETRLNEAIKNEEITEDEARKIYFTERDEEDE